MTAVLLVNLLGAVGCGAMSVYIYRRRSMQDEAIAFRQKLESSKWMKYVPFLWPARFAPDPRSRKWQAHEQANRLFGAAIAALMAVVLFAVFVANVIHVLRASMAP